MKKFYLFLILSLSLPCFQLAQAFNPKKTCVKAASAAVAGAAALAGSTVLLATGMAFKMLFCTGAHFYFPNFCQFDWDPHHKTEKALFIIAVSAAALGFKYGETVYRGYYT